jgi:hypothetical protein
MKTTVLLLSTVACLSAVGCAGTLTADEQQRLFDEHSGTGGAGPTSTTTSSTSTGSGGSGPAVDMCVVNTTALKSCQAAGCHGGMPPLSAGLDLSATAVTTNAKSFKDKLNTGTDPMGGGCMPGTFKLVDSANPMNSLIYTKVEAPGDMATHPCGSKMPVIGTFTSADKMCILNWVMSVASLP